MQAGTLQLKAYLAFVEREMAVQLSVVIAGTSIRKMNPMAPAKPHTLRREATCRQGCCS